MELIIGSHVSFKKDTQMLGSVEETLKYNANTFMFYTGAPQNTARIPIDLELTNKAKELMKENNIDIKNVVVHAPYIINLANSNNFDFNVRFLKEEISRVESLGVDKLVLHPGSHVGQGVEVGIKNIIDSLNVSLTDNTKVTICLETMAGKGSEVGRSFEEIRAIIDKVRLNEKLGVCLDTCHVFDAGYDIVNNLDEVIDEFDRVIGLDRLKAVHLNDTKNPFESHKDRHEKIGDGFLGVEAITKIINHEKLRDLPFFLETPNDIDGYEREIALLKTLYL